MIEITTEERRLLILPGRHIMELAEENASHDVSSFKVQGHVCGPLSPGIMYVGFQGSVVGYSSSQRREIGKRLPCWCLEHN